MPTLRDYQRADVDAVLSAKTRALILSTPGTGKTPIACRALRETPGAFPALVVAPASMAIQWRRELRRWAPDLVVAELDGIPKTTPLRRAHVYVTSWALLAPWVDRLSRVGLRSAVLDEVHLARHSGTLRAGAAAELVAAAPFLVGLTGTPVVAGAEDLAAIVSLWGDRPPIQIRRLLDEVAPDVPPKTRAVVFVELRPADAARYGRAEADFSAYLEEIGRAPAEIRRAMAAEVFVRIGELRRILEIGKVWAAADWTARAVLVGEPVVLFFDSLEAVRRMRRLLTHQRIRSLVIEGATSTTERQRAIDAFQRGRVPVLLCTRAGTEGITLHAARLCLFVGRYWNATEEEQAEDRLRRIGQKRSVTATRLHALATLDDRLAEIVDDKRARAGRIVRSVDVEAEIVDELIARWGAHVRPSQDHHHQETSALGRGALPAPLPPTPSICALDFARTGWSATSAARWCRMHGLAPKATIDGDRSLRVCFWTGQNPVARRITADIRALVDPVAERRCLPRR